MITPKKILLTNDDGILSPLLVPFINALSKYFEVYVMVPDRERSTMSQALTILTPLRAREIKNPLYSAAKKTYVLNGTTADCAKVALHYFFKDQIDAVISGINLGPNLGTDIIYSGTVAGATEGLFENIPAAALSIYTLEEYSPFEPACEFATQILLKHFPQKGDLYNINLPFNTDYSKTETVFTKLGKVPWMDLLERREDPRGVEYFWLQGKINKKVVPEPDTDIEAVQNGKVSITPVLLDRTDFEKLNKLQK